MEEQAVVPMDPDSPRDMIKKTVEQLIEEMKAVEIKTDGDYKAMDTWRGRAKETIKVVDAAFESERVEKKAAYDAVNDAKNTFKKPLNLALDVVNEKMTAYITEKEKARRKAEADAREAEFKKKEEDRLVEAQNLSSMGRSAQADAVLEKKITVSKAAVAAVVPAKLGKTQERWTASVTDLPAFLAEASGISALAACVEVSEAKLAAYFKANPDVKVAGAVGSQTFIPIM